MTRVQSQIAASAQPPLSNPSHGADADVCICEAVYRAHFASVWRNLRRLGVAEQSLSDAAQDVFLVVHRKLPAFEGRAPLSSWVFSIATRVARQYRRTRRRKELVDAEDSAAVADGCSPTPEGAAAQDESLRRLLGLLDALSEEKREAFVLSDLEGMTIAEVAAVLEENPNTISSRIRAARLELRAILVAARADEGGRHG